MRRGSSTVVALVGDVREALLADVALLPNVAVVRSEAEGFEAAVEASSRAAGRLAPYVVVGADPLAEVAQEWRAMWKPGAGSARFEERAGEALAAWRGGRFELPDYYLILAEEHDAEGTPHPLDLHLGVLRARRPSRVAVVVRGEEREEAARVEAALRGLGQGPWWPPLDRLLEAARTFVPGPEAEGVRLSG